jgi:FtsH-binding integral membrane protein
MEIYALVTFAVAAVGGLYLASKVLRGNFAPWAVSLIHAGLGAIGLLLLITAYLEGPSNVVVPLLILLIAALGGFFLASFHLRKKLPPKAIVVVHAVVAVIGVLSLAVVGLA